MLLDKAFYDYDFEPRKEKAKFTEEDTRLMSRDEIADLFKYAIERDNPTASVDKLQSEIMRNENL